MKTFVISASVVLVLMFVQPSIQQIDEIIFNAANTTEEFEFFYDEPNRNTHAGECWIKSELDLLFTCEEYDALINLNSSTSGRRKRTAGINPGAHGGQRWTNNNVPYEITRAIGSRGRAAISAAVADWSRYTCLTFTHSSRRGNKLRFDNGGGCYSRVGMVGGAQTVGLAPGCRVKGVVIHEMGHAIGLHHEQTRPDRDQHVQIISNNIPPRVRYNFDRYTWRIIKNMGIPYDYTSIMHYGKTAFSRNGGLTIKTKNPRMQNTIGNRSGLSFRDIKSVNIMYNCKRATRGCTKTDSQCPGEGFIGKDCKCWCPGSPYRICTGGGGGGGGGGTTRRPTTRTTRRPTTGRRNCRDQHTSCSYWGRIGECNRNPSYMHVYCKKACNKCSGGGGGGGGGGTGSRSCKDLHYNCPNWAKKNFCNGSYKTYMKTNCQRSCGLCRGRAAYRAETTTDSSCRDQNQHCEDWAKIGECTANPAYMTVSCKKACGLCGAAAAAADSTCTDNSEHCSYWAGIGECTNNAAYMNLNCKQSCNRCSSGNEAAVADSTCTNNNAHCASWATIGECTNNAAYMLLNCKLACNRCQ